MVDIATSLGEVLDYNPDAFGPHGLLSRSPRLAGSIALNLDSLIVVDAAAYAHGFVNEGESLIVASGNAQAGFPQAAQKFWGENYQNIDPSLYEVTDGNSPTTKASAKNLPVLFENLGVERAALVTAGYHAKALAKLYKQEQDMIGLVIVAEAILAERSEHDREKMDEFTRSKNYHKQEVIERARNVPLVQSIGTPLVRQWRKLTLERH